MPAPLFSEVSLLTLHVTDFDRAVAFYRDTLGLPVNEMVADAGWVEFKMGNGVNIGLHRDDCAPDGRRAGGTTGFFIGCADAKATEAELKARGVKVTQEATTMPFGTMVAFEDPDGNEFAFLQPLQA